MSRETKLLGGFLALLAVSSLAGGASLIFNGTLSVATGLSCKAICGLALLVSEVLGLKAGTYAEGTLWLVVGTLLGLLGYRILRSGGGGA